MLTRLLGGSVILICAILLRLLRLAHVHTPVLRLPGVDRVLRHSHFSRYVLRLSPCLQLLQRPDHLRFCVPAP